LTCAVLLSLVAAGCGVVRYRYDAAYPRPDFVVGRVSPHTYRVVGDEASVPTAELCAQFVCMVGVQNMLETGLRSSLTQVATEAPDDTEPDYLVHFDHMHLMLTSMSSIGIVWSATVTDTRTGLAIAHLEGVDSGPASRIEGAPEAVRLASLSVIRRITDALRHSPLAS
jgi:hypothetical protein